MRYILATTLLVGVLTSTFAAEGYPDEDIQEYVEEPAAAPTPPKKPAKKACSNVLRRNSSMTISVVGQGVAPAFAISHAQAYALAKRAAMADAYRLIGEKVNGVVVEGKDTVKNMVMQRSTVNTHVQAMIKNATVAETTFKDGLCEVEMEIQLSYDEF